MDVSTWKSVWRTIFVVSSIMFYLTVAIVAYRGFGDMKQMIRQMISKR